MSFSELLSLLGNAGEFIGGTLIIVTLIYLSIQSKQSVKIGYWQMYTTSVATFSTLNCEVAKDPQLSRLRDSFMGPNSAKLSDEDQLRSRALFDAYLGVIENAYWMNKEFQNKSAEDRWKQQLSWISSNDNGSRFWSAAKHTVTKEFAEFVDALSLSNQSDVDQKDS